MQALPIPDLVTLWNHKLPLAVFCDGSKGSIPEGLLLTRLYKACSPQPHLTRQQTDEAALLLLPKFTNKDHQAQRLNHFSNILVESVLGQ